MTAKTKEVILKCRFGDHLPDPRVAVELDASSADYLISQGLAELPKADTVVQVDTSALDAEITRLNAEIVILNDVPKGEKASKDKLAEANQSIKTLNETVATLTTERDNALTELALAKGASNGTDNTPSK